MLHVRWVNNIILVIGICCFGLPSSKMLTVPVLKSDADYGHYPVTNNFPQMPDRSESLARV